MQINVLAAHVFHRRVKTDLKCWFLLKSISTLLDAWHCQTLNPFMNLRSTNWCTNVMYFSLSLVKKTGCKDLSESRIGIIQTGFNCFYRLDFHCLCGISRLLSREKSIAMVSGWGCKLVIDLRRAGGWSSVEKEFEAMAKLSRAFCWVKFGESLGMRWIFLSHSREMEMRRRNLDLLRMGTKLGGLSFEENVENKMKNWKFICRIHARAELFRNQRFFRISSSADFFLCSNRLNIQRLSRFWNSHFRLSKLQPHSQPPTALTKEKQNYAVQKQKSFNSDFQVLIDTSNKQKYEIPI
jgi:hypothetical protein